MDKNIIELQNKIKEKEKELFELKQEYDKFPRLVLMYIKKKGKHTFIFQPLKQVHNLESSGWVVIEDFTKKAVELGLI